MLAIKLDLTEFGTSVFSVLRTVGLLDILDIVIVAFLFYEVIALVRQTRALQLLKGIAIFLTANLVARQLQLGALSYILSNILQFGLVTMVVVFQPELRRALEQVGRANFLALSLFHNETESDKQRTRWQSAIAAICDSAESMGETRTGALMVIERQLSLMDVVRTGTVMECNINPEIIGTVFYEGSPLHDGAVVVRDGAIVAAGCVLPLSPNLEISKEMGTRHRAALGISEQSDAIAVVVSEETGTVSLAKSGKLVRRLDRQNLYSMLCTELLPPEEVVTGKRIFSWGGKK